VNDAGQGCPANMGTPIGLGRAEPGRHKHSRNDILIFTIGDTKEKARGTWNDRASACGQPKGRAPEKWSTCRDFPGNSSIYWTRNRGRCGSERSARLWPESDPRAVFWTVGSAVAIRAAPSVAGWLAKTLRTLIVLVCTACSKNLTRTSPTRLLSDGTVSLGGICRT